MLETFQDRLVTELRLAGASTIDEANMVLQEFLPRFNARFAVAAEQPETAYRPEPDELSLTETICIKDTRKVARDNTVKYQWRVLQLLPGAERPSYAGLRVEVLERADGELMILYQGAPVDFQEGSPPSSALWGAASACSPDPELQEVADGVVNSYMNEAQRERLATLESYGQDEVNYERTGIEGKVVKRRGGKGKPVRHQLHRGPLLRHSRPAGKRYSWPVSRDSRYGPLPGSWAWPAIQSENTSKQTVRPPRNSAPRSVPKQRLSPHR